MFHTMKWFAGGIAALALTAMPVLAAGPPTTVTIPKAALKKIPNQAVIAELHAAKMLLEKADHDYEGHRAKAVQEITTAMHELQGNHKKKKGNGTAQAKPQKPAGAKAKPAAAANANGKGKGKGKGKGNADNKLKEPQAVSDAQLQQAQKILANALTKIPATHPKAAANVKAAIGELTTALKIK